MTRRHLKRKPPAPFARHEGRHRRRWLDELRKRKPEPAAAPVDDFSRPRTVPLGMWPLAGTDPFFTDNPLKEAS
ncbi:hypothetical protein ACQEUU_37010 [Nonomuraea sp. CA-218870]|uniref:hypothetical protein n=1 Tax=Nonomuraea sp. CA-218870 TaxID=3239998 RepID=UPI003D9249BF